MNDGKVMAAPMLLTPKVGCIHIQFDHVPITKIHLLAAAMTRRTFLQIPPLKIPS